LTQNSNTVELVNFLEKKSKSSHLYQSNHIDDNIIWNHEQKTKLEKVKIEDSKSKTNFFFTTMPFSFWAVLATWLHVGAPRKIHEN
jgi:hypothetical protein